MKKVLVPHPTCRFWLLVGLVILLWLGPGLTDYFFPSPVVIYQQGDESRRAIALTFDDGPSARFTPQILDLLAGYQVHATFFLLGRHARRYPRLVQALVAQGHEIGNHTFSHPHLAQINQATLAQELELTKGLLRRLGARLHGLFRPPYSELSEAAARYLDRTGRKIILWNVDAGDWLNLPASEIVSRVQGGLKNGAIVIFHDNNEYDNANRQPTVDALRILLPRLRAAGFCCQTVSELLHLP